MKQKYAISFLTMAIIPSYAAENIQYKPVQLAISSVVGPENHKIMGFKQLSFLKMSDTVTMCYAVALINNKLHAIKKNILDNEPWSYEQKFKNSPVIFFGLLGTQKICATSNDGIYLFRKNPPTAKNPTWSKPWKFEKYTEGALSIAGRSEQAFWVTTYANATLNTVWEVTKNGLNEPLIKETNSVAVGFTEDGNTGWFIVYDAEDSVLEVKNFPQKNTKNSFIENSYNIDLATITQLAPIDDTRALFLDKTGNGLYELTNEGTITKIFDTHIDACTLFFTVVNGKTVPTPVIAIGNILYKLEPGKIVQSATQESKSKSTNLSELRSVAKTRNAQPQMVLTAPAQTIEISTAQEPLVTQKQGSFTTKKLTLPAPNRQLITRLPQGKRDALLKQAKPAEEKPATENVTIKDDNENVNQISLTASQKNTIARFLKSKQFKEALQRSIGQTLYATFFTSLMTPREYEILALNKNPRPWEKFLIRPSYTEQFKNTLYGVSRGLLGQKAAIQDAYDFPKTAEGTRAFLLHTLHEQFEGLYKDIWLNPALWYKYVEQNPQIQAIFIYPVQYGQYWFRPLPQVPAKARITQQTPTARTITAQ